MYKPSLQSLSLQRIFLRTISSKIQTLLSPLTVTMSPSSQFCGCDRNQSRGRVSPISPPNSRLQTPYSTVTGRGSPSSTPVSGHLVRSAVPSPIFVNASGYSSSKRYQATENISEQPSSDFTLVEDEFPSLSSVTSQKKILGKNKIITAIEKKSRDNHSQTSSSKEVKNSNEKPRDDESSSSNSLSLDDETSLPKSFGKKISDSQRMLKTRPTYAVNNGNQGFYPDSNVDSYNGRFKVEKYAGNSVGDRYRYFGEASNEIEPFDICKFERRNYRKSYSFGENENNNEHPLEVPNQILRPGMVLLKNYITRDQQIDIVRKCRELGLGMGGFYRPGYQDGAKLRLQMMCLGLNWDAETGKYESRRPFDGCEPPSIPPDFSRLVENAIRDSHAIIKEESLVANVEEVLPSMTPDICIVNFYTTTGRLGLHKDHDETPESLRKGLPVVSFSIGDSAEFLYGDQRDPNKAKDVILESGDVLIFGGESRHVFHGVSYIIPNSAPEFLLNDAKIRPGRLNLTFRQY